MRGIGLRMRPMAREYKDGGQLFRMKVNFHKGKKTAEANTSIKIISNMMAPSKTM
jgi:hypothetical protein